MSFTFKGASSKSDLASIQPMLAHPFYGPDQKTMKAGKYLTKNKGVYYQPKLDGIRCIAGMVGGKVYLYSRNGKPITSMVHIQKELMSILNEGEIWDGELYLMGKIEEDGELVDIDFNYISHLVRPQLPVEGSERVEYHVFDAVVFDKDYATRYINEVVPRIEQHRRTNAIIRTNIHIKSVPTLEVKYDRIAMEKQHDEWVDMGYEGLMIRTISAKGYECKRTNDLIKYKQFVDDDFKIVGYIEGKGKLVNHLGAFILEVIVNGEKKTFKAKPDGEQGRLATIWKEREEWIGRVVIVRYQNLSREGKPRFPGIKGIRLEQ
jgi:DNA ligase-1